MKQHGACIDTKNSEKRPNYIFLKEKVREYACLAVFGSFKKLKVTFLAGCPLDGTLHTAWIELRNYQACPKALRNYGKPKISVFLMPGHDCTGPRPLAS